MIKLKAFFTYFGSKYRSAKYYPKPNYNKIIEPFAGSAGYSVYNYVKQIKLYDISEIIVSVWNYLINVKDSEILSLPTIIEHLDCLVLTQEQKWLIGFWLGKNKRYPSKSPCRWAKEGQDNFWSEKIKYRIANQLKYIRHWKCYQKSYKYIDNEKATWFIDPPYNNSNGDLYRTNFNDYGHLAKYCEERLGQTIVCEQKGSSWLDFKPLISDEVVWIKNN